MPVPEKHFVNGNASAAALSRRARAGDVRAGLLLGCGAQVLAGAGRVRDRGRLCRRRHAEPDLRGSVQRPDRAQRGRAGRVRSQEDELRSHAQGVLGEPRPDPGHAPGQRCRHAVSLRHLCHLARAAQAGRGLARYVPEQAEAGRLRRRSRPRSSTRRRSTTPRTITSSIWRRTPAAIAASAAPA